MVKSDVSLYFTQLVSLRKTVLGNSRAIICEFLNSSKYLGDK